MTKIYLQSFFLQAGSFKKLLPTLLFLLLSANLFCQDNSEKPQVDEKFYQNQLIEKAMEQLLIERPDADTAYFKRQLIEKGYMDDPYKIDKSLLRGKWVLTQLDVRNNKRELEANEKEKLRNSYLRALPLECASLNFYNGNRYTLVHHQGSETNGIWELTGNVLTIAGDVSPSCTECTPHKREFIIRNITPTLLLVDYHGEEDSDRQNYYGQLTFTKP